MATENFKVKNGLDVGDVEIISSEGAINATQIKVGGAPISSSFIGGDMGLLSQQTIYDAFGVATSNLTEQIDLASPQGVMNSVDMGTIQ